MNPTIAVTNLVSIYLKLGKEEGQKRLTRARFNCTMRLKASCLAV
ncbi:hypothetical protein BH11CYA1_BH11CYA1_40270 [soil metagenome]